MEEKRRVKYCSFNVAYLGKISCIAVIDNDSDEYCKDHIGLVCIDCGKTATRYHFPANNDHSRPMCEVCFRIHFDEWKKEVLNEK